MTWQESLFLFFKPFDESLLKLINQDWTNSAFDWFFPAITDLHKGFYFKTVFVPALIGIIIARMGKKGIFTVIGMLVSVGLSDLFGNLLKHLFSRPRPPAAGLTELIVRAPEYGGFSFVSNHAMNMFSLFGFLWVLYPKAAKLFLPFAALVAYSRVYCGVHYPTDIIVGGLVGLLLGYCVARLVKWKLLSQEKING